MNNELMFSSKDDAWGTPQDFYDTLHDKYNFELDVCASEDNAKCKDYYTEEQNCLDKDWTNKVCFMNPPYNRKIPKFVNKAREESLRGATVVCLLPARTCTRWYHEYIWNQDTNTWREGVSGNFIKGRLTFGTDKYWRWVWEQPFLNGKKNSLYKQYGKKNAAPFPSMVIVFKKYKQI